MATMKLLDDMELICLKMIRSVADGCHAGDKHACPTSSDVCFLLLLKWQKSHKISSRSSGRQS